MKCRPPHLCSCSTSLLSPAASWLPPPAPLFASGDFGSIQEINWSLPPSLPQPQRTQREENGSKSRRAQPACRETSRAIHKHLQQKQFTCITSYHFGWTPRRRAGPCVGGLPEKFGWIPEHAWEREFLARSGTQLECEETAIPSADCTSSKKSASVHTCPCAPFYREMKGLLHTDNTLSLREYS
jgi:hypothetical protein